jgi:hypothetical protein
MPKKEREKMRQMRISVPVALIVATTLAPLQACQGGRFSPGPSTDGSGGLRSPGSEDVNRVWGVTVSDPFNLSPTLRR